MAEASQQPKEWSRQSCRRDRTSARRWPLSRREDLLRLRAIARLRARALPDAMSWSDLLHEAVLRALTGARPWPPGVSLLAFLAGVMRSLCDEYWRRHRRQHDLPAPQDSGGADDPERACAAAEALAYIQRLFASDKAAPKVITALTSGHDRSGDPSSMRFDRGRIRHDTPADTPWNGNFSLHLRTKCATRGVRPVGRATSHARKCGHCWTKPSPRATTALLQHCRPTLAPDRTGFSAFRGSVAPGRTVVLSSPLLLLGLSAGISGSQDKRLL
jgi:DNA-directed RNA polymerase specialized sigma24 family protein